MLPSDGASWSRINKELSVVSAKYLKAVYLILGIQHLIFQTALYLIMFPGLSAPRSYEL